MRIITLILITIFFFGCQSNKKIEANSKTTDIDKAEILTVLNEQSKAWSQGDLELFMEGYWKNDSLKFYGRNGLTKGWQNTLNNYKKGYPNKDETGQLKFVINDVSIIENNTYWVMGEYHLTRNIGDANGVFIVIFKKINGEWKIIADMSC